MHLLVEAQDERSLARGMNGLGVRVAKGLNRVMGRSGKVLDDRYHGHILRTRRRCGGRAITSCRMRTSTWARRGGPVFVAHALVAPETWLMRLHC